METPLHQAVSVSGDGVLEADTTVDGIALRFEWRNTGEQDREQYAKRPDFRRGRLVRVSLQDF